MLNLRQMRERLAALLAANTALLDAAERADLLELSEADDATFKANEAEIAKLKAAIARREGHDAAVADANTRRPAAARGQATEGEGDGGQDTNGNFRQHGDPAVKSFEHFGQFMFAVRFNQNDPRLADLWKEGDPNRQTAFMGTMNEAGQFVAEQRMDEGASGGFMVPKQFREEILRIEPATSIVRPRARVIPAGFPPDAAISMPALNQDGAAPANVFGGVTVDWISEGAAKPETDARFKEITWEPKEVAGHIVTTDKLLRNWQAAGPFLSQLLRDAISQAEDFAFISGNGVGRPLGFLNSPAAITVPRDTAGQVKYADLVAMVAVVLMQGGSPVWTASQSVLPQLLTMTDGDGRLIFNNAPANGLGPTLLGYPIFWNNRLPGLGSDGDLAITDLSRYIIKDGSGPFVASSEHVKFLENKTVIKAFWNVDGRPWMTAPFTSENGYQVSPFVKLGVPG